jgi:hypothetical protein
MVAPLSVRKMVQRHSQNRAHGSTIVDSPQPRCDLSEAANAYGLAPCRLTSPRRAADRCDQRPSRASFTNWFRLYRIRSASFHTGVKDVGSSSLLILVAKSEIPAIHVRQADENLVCQRAGRREKDFASSITFGETRQFRNLITFSHTQAGTADHAIY